MNERIEALRRQMRESQADAVLVTLPINRRYLTGYTATDSTSGASAGWLLVTGERAVLLVGFLGLEQAQKECSGLEIQQFVGTPNALATQLVKDGGVHRLAFEGNHMTYLTHAELSGQIGAGIELVPIDGWVEGVRATKDESEIEKIKQAAAITDSALLHVLDVLKPGITERELAWKAERYMREHGAEKMAFDVAVASGPNTSVPHNEPSDRPIAPGEPIWIDMGAQFEGYCADLTRSFCLGKPDERLREVWNLVLRAQQTAIDGARAGMSGREADSLARDVIVAAGHGSEFGHSLGHGVGLVVHERPRLSQLSPDTLGPGMVATFEPGVYVAGWGGVRIEDLGVIREGGVEVLSAAPKMLSVG